MTSHNAEINNGQYNSAIGETTIKAYCNDSNGFAIYTIGYTGNEEGNNVLTNSTLGNTHDIVTGTATSGNTSNWAMKLSTIASPAPTYPIIIAGTSADTLKEQGDPDYSTFQEVPDDYTKVAYRTSNTDIGTNAEGSTLKSTYQAYISSTQPAGTYTGQVKYVLVHPYDTAAPIISISIEDAFAKAGKTKYNGYYKMQDMSASICSTVNTYEEDSKAQLIDIRDNQTYYVAKLLDDKCWMVENLNIAGGTELSSDDTDFDSSYTLPTTNGWSVSNGKLILPASAIKNENDNNLTDNTQFSDNNYAYVFNSDNKTNCGNLYDNNPCYSYYSWNAATLGSAELVEAGNNADAPYSICPKSWKLPTAYGKNVTDWQTLSDTFALARHYGSDVADGVYTEKGDFYVLAGPGTVPNFLLSGSYSSGASGGLGTDASYWSSTLGDYYGYGFATKYNFGSWYFNWAYNAADRRYGNSVRCLVK